MKRVISFITMTVILSLLTSSIVVCAQSYRDKYVYGDRYTVVAEGTNDDNEVGYVTVTVTKIDKADGSDSNYSKVKADIIGKSGDQYSIETDNILKLGESTNIPLMYAYPSGNYMRLRMKGNISSLDCIVNFNAAISTQ